jgi:CMP/dCMP kinase
MSSAPVITLDGLSGSGKGTYSLMLAQHLGWHYLDSGALYRAIAWAILHHEVDCEKSEALQALLGRIDITMESRPKENVFSVFCDGHDITHEIRTEEVSSMASVSAKIQIVRDHLLGLNRSFRRLPGLVADGRDMGTVVFPDASIKFYLDASPEVRAERRCRQLKQKGISVSLRDVLDELMRRDERDQNRSIAPAVPASDVVHVDTADKTIDAVFAELMKTVAHLKLD